MSARPGVPFVLSAAVWTFACSSPGGTPNVESASGIQQCHARAEVARFMTIPKAALTAAARNWGFLTTPFKYLSTTFDGPHAWEKTGCIAAGSGHPLREAQHSTDGFYTIDVAIVDMRVEDISVPSGRFVRLEVIPGTAAHRSLEHRRPKPSDLIAFNGALVWDKDRDVDHPHGHMEVHPHNAIDFLTAEH